MERPEIVWLPSIAPSGLTFYTGDQFPAWKGNLFVGAMKVGRIHQTGHLERIVFNRQGDELRREWLLTELKQRIRDVRQGPDGFLYVLTDEDEAALLRLAPPSDDSRVAHGHSQPTDRASRAWANGGLQSVGIDDDDDGQDQFSR